MKKAFTFAELMISLVVISVITAILYPTIADVGINENEALFKSAYRSMSLALAEVMNEQPNGIVPNDLCNQMANKLNVRINPGGAGNGCPNITTTNGMRWFIPNDLNCASGGNPADCDFFILVDVAPSNNNVENTVQNNITATPTAFQRPGAVDAAGNPVVRAANLQTDAQGSFFGACPQGAYGAGTADPGRQQDTFVFTVSKTGQIQTVDGAGIAHLESRNLTEPEEQALNNIFHPQP